MSDLDPDRPLTRRERRLREMGETGAVPTIDVTADPFAQAAPEPVAPVTPAAPAVDIEISPYDENGRLRSRSEIRALREQAEAEAAAATAAAAPAQPVPPVEPEPPVAAAPQTVEPLPPIVEPLPPVAEPTPQLVEPEPTPEPRGTIFDPPATQAFSFDELIDAPLDPPEASVPVQVPANFFVDDASEPEPEPEPEFEVQAIVDVPPLDEVEPVVEAEIVEADPPVAARAQEYSFPDIAPLDEQVSVFDQPDAGGEQGGGDFDELISRAVAQESTNTTTNTSALILPTLNDTGDLSGPLGETGELFVTGSITLPKSLGETGGHMPLRRSGDGDGLDEFGLESMPTSNPILPVSASRAVSAVGAAGPVVGQETKEKSKLPLVLSLIGGVLVLAVGGLFVWWGIDTGMFQ